MTILLPTRPGSSPARGTLGPALLMRVAHAHALFSLRRRSRSMLWTRSSLLSMAVFALTWGCVNFLWLMLLAARARVRALARAVCCPDSGLDAQVRRGSWLSLSYARLRSSISYTFAFLMMCFPNVRMRPSCGAIFIPPRRGVCGSTTFRRPSRQPPCFGSAACLASLPSCRSVNHGVARERLWELQLFSHFTLGRRRVLWPISQRAFLESDPAAVEEPAGRDRVRERRKAPTPLLGHDESSFAIRSSRRQVPPGYGHHFPLVRCKAAQASGRAAGRPVERVHRIQRSFGALLTFLGRFSSSPS